MPMGPGKYDDECTRIMEDQQAEGIILIIVGGKKGHGFSCQATPQVVAGLPQILRNVALELESSARSTDFQN